MRTTKLNRKQFVNHILYTNSQELANDCDRWGKTEWANELRKVTLRNAESDVISYVLWDVRSYVRSDVLSYVRSYVLSDVRSYVLWDVCSYMRSDVQTQLVKEFINSYVYAGGKLSALKAKKLNTKLLKDIENQKWFLRQDKWHGKNSCGTTHCRAGGTVIIMRDIGKELEELIGTPMAAAMINYATDATIPDYWNMDNDAVLSDIQACAEKEKQS